MPTRLGVSREPGVRIRRPGRLRDYLEEAGRAAGMAQGGLSPADLGVTQAAEGKKIVAVSTEPVFSRALVDQALGVAGRLGTEVVGLSVCRAGAEGQGEHAAKARDLFVLRAQESAAGFAARAAAEGIPFRHVLRFGKPADLVEQECANLKRVEFVLADKEQRSREGFTVSMTLFEVIG